MVDFIVPMNSESFERRNAPPLLRTKLFVPRMRQRLVARERLADALERGLSAGVTLLVAPAGFGKTTAVCQALARRALPAAWLSLDHEDDEPERFLRYLTASLSTLNDSIGEVASTMLRAAAPVPPENVATALLNGAVEYGSDFVLVLDDFHVVSEEAVLRVVDFVAAHLGPNMRLLIASRTEPPLALGALRARGRLVDVRADDLRFSTAEVRDLVRAEAGIELDDESVQLLDRTTEGWAAALQLASVSLRDRAGAADLVRGLERSHELMFDFLADEVFARLAPELRAFLLAIAPLERFCAPLCSAVAAPRTDAAELLERVERLNLFLTPLDNHREWYRFHRLFADFLRSRAERELGPDALRAALLAAIEWCAASGLWNDAIGYALGGSEYDRAAALIAQVTPKMFADGELIAFRSWVARLPRPVLERNVGVCISYAWSLIATGKAAEVPELLSHIGRQIHIDPDHPTKPAELPEPLRVPAGTLWLMRAQLALGERDLRRANLLASRAVAAVAQPWREGAEPVEAGEIESTGYFLLAGAHELSGELGKAREFYGRVALRSNPPINPYLTPMAIAHRASIEQIQAHLPEAAAIYEQVVGELDRPGTKMSALAGLSLVGYGTILAEWNRLDDALERLERGVRLGRSWSNWEIVLPGARAIARVKNMLGDAPGARRAIDELSADNAAFGLEPDPMVDALRALYHRSQPNGGAAPDDITRVIERARQPREALTFMEESVALVEAEVLLLAGMAREALARAAAIERVARVGERWHDLIAALILKACALATGDSRRQALAAVTEAIELGERPGYVLSFIERGEPMRALIAECSGHETYRARLLAAYEAREAVSGMDAGLRAPAGAPSTARRGAAASPRAAIHGAADLQHAAGGGAAYGGGAADDVSRAAVPRAAAQPAVGGDPQSGPGAEHARALLSDRELEVLRLLVNGGSNQEIADALFVSPNTIKTHLKNIFTKLGAGNRTQAVAKAHEIGI